ncbi:MAG: DUF3990 domain-containing protein [Treponema sp.]|nr:DUF3990 domain-containing protein [Treponema sp.]
MKLFHGGTASVEEPVIMPSLSGRDFGTGFYCTDIQSQAEKWAQRQGRIRRFKSVLNVYEFDKDSAQKNLNYKAFTDYAMEWLELVVKCRKDAQFVHGFDIVYGKIANDDVGETVQAVINGLMPLDFALQRLAFMDSNNQYCFCTKKSLGYLIFIESIILD